MRAAEDAGFQEPTPIQSAVIAAIIAGRDVLACAPTGSGKTAAFGLPLLQQALARPHPPHRRGNQIAALVIAPTRELVMQIGAVLAEFGRHLPERIKIVAAYGGVSINPQMLALRGGAEIVVATPGRLLDLAQHNAVKFDQLRVLVLDEADRMLSVGFRDELSQLLALLPAQRQNLLFSATFPQALASLTSLLRDPLEVPIGLVPDETPEPKIAQHVYVVEPARKAALLIHLLRERELERALVFVSVKKTGDALLATLSRAKIAAAIFHADKSQHERTRSLADFAAGKTRVLIATDLAARGLDIEDLPVVINFELPRSPNDYLHRIGRTGRAGRSGLAISLIGRDDEQHFCVIERRLKQRLPRERIPAFEPRERDIDY